jgi:hypothetical protein
VRVLTWSALVLLGHYLVATWSPLGHLMYLVTTGHYLATTWFHWSYGLVTPLGHYLVTTWAPLVTTGRYWALLLGHTWSLLGHHWSLLGHYLSPLVTLLGHPWSLLGHYLVTTWSPPGHRWSYFARFCRFGCAEIDFSHITDAQTRRERENGLLATTKSGTGEWKKILSS